MSKEGRLGGRQLQTAWVIAIFCVSLFVAGLCLGYLVGTNSRNSHNVLAQAENPRSPPDHQSLQNAEAVSARSSARHFSSYQRVIGDNFFNDTLVEPQIYGISLLNVVEPARKFAFQAFNPAILGLPHRERSIVQTVYPAAVYLGALRIKNNQCKKLKRPIAQPAFDFVSEAGLREEEFSTVFFVLDSTFQIVGKVELARLSVGEDVRLQFVSGAIMATWMNYSPLIGERGWYAKTVNLSATEDRVEVSFLPPAAGIPAFKARGRNFGMFDFNRTARFLEWVSEPLAVDPCIDAFDDFKHVVSILKIPSKDGSEMIQRSYKVHNSISPLLLADNKLLLIGHVHGPMGWGTGPHRPNSGSLYAHMFLLADARPDWGLLGMSDPWCIPSPLHPDQCELVQFVSSATLDGPDLVLAFGVNDCDARLARLPLEQAIAMAKQRSPTTVGRVNRDCDKRKR